MKYVNKFIILLFVLSTSIYSQENYYIQTNQELFGSFEMYLEALANDGQDAADLLETIDYYSNNPIDLLNSNPNQILNIPGLSYFDAFGIHDALKRDNTLTHHDICEMFGFNEYQRWILENCSILGKSVKKLNVKVRERSSYQLETPVGYEKNNYVGDQWNLLQKYQANYSVNNINLGGGATINKNSGEKNIDEYTSGFAFIEIDEAKLIVGDFEIQAGMGNIFGDAYKQSKGINVINPTISFTNKVSPYTSKMDYRVMRGAATRLDFPIISNMNISSSIWYSNAPRSISFDKDRTYIASVFTTGYYRTETDLLKKNNATEQNIGGTIEINGCNYNLGALLTHIAYPLEIRSTAGRAFSGKEGYLGSVFGSFNFKNVFISGEISTDNNNNYAVRMGSAYKSKELDLAIQFRSFDDKFRSPYGSMFGEYSYPANEIGLYTGFIWEPNKMHKISSFIDIYSSYAPPSTVDSVVSGFEIFGQYDYTINKKHKLTFRINEENKTRQSTVDKIRKVYQSDDIKFRIEYETKMIKDLIFRSRSEVRYLYNKNITDDEFGWSFFIDANYKMTDWLRIKGRTSIFSTSSYSSSIWQFSYFYPGYSLTSSLYLDGIKSFLQAQFTINKMISIHIRFENLYKPDETTLGSGNEQINSNSQNRIYCQIDFNI